MTQNNPNIGGQNPPVIVDPFYDGVQQIPQIPVTAQPPVTNEHVSMLPRGQAGYGTVVPRATRDGGQAGWRPDTPPPALLQANIIDSADPNRPVRYSMDLGQINGTQAAAAVAAAQVAGAHVDDEPAMALAHIARDQAANPQQRQAPLPMPGTYVAPRANSNGGQDVVGVAQTPQYNGTVEAQIEEEIQRRLRAQGYAQPAGQSAEPEQLIRQDTAPVSPLASFGGGRRPRALDLEDDDTVNSYTNGHAAAAAPPNVQASFEITLEGEVGQPNHQTTTIQGFYHAVLREGINLILVYDKRWQGGTIYMPDVLEKPMGVFVSGSPNMFLVRSTGQQFTHDSKQYCMLLIEDELPVPPGG